MMQLQDPTFHSLSEDLRTDCISVPYLEDISGLLSDNDKDMANQNRMVLKVTMNIGQIMNKMFRQHESIFI